MVFGYCDVIVAILSKHPSLQFCSWWFDTFFPAPKLFVSPISPLSPWSSFTRLTPFLLPFSPALFSSPSPSLAGPHPVYEPDFIPPSPLSTIPHCSLSLPLSPSPGHKPDSTPSPSPVPSLPAWSNHPAWLLCLGSLYRNNTHTSPT